MIKKAEEKDISNIIQVHIDSFGKNHFSAVFSKSMLKRYFELLLSMNEFNFVYYEDDNNTLLGYIIAGYKSHIAVNNFTKENYWYLIFTLIRNPKFITEKVIELFNRKITKRKERKSKCRLYLIGVNKIYKGKGIGKTLVNHLEEELEKNGIISYGLSVRKDNTEAIKFYEKSGYLVEYKDAKSIYYLKEF